MKSAMEAVKRILHRVGLVIHSDGMTTLWRWCNRSHVLLGALLVLMVVWTLIGRGENDLLNWSRYHITNDSRGYVRPFHLKSLTPPVYHWFVQAASVTGYEGTPPLGTTTLAETSVLERLAEPLYRVVFVQRLIFLGSIFTFLYTLTLIHLLNCLVMVVFMFPNNRYVNATEFLVFAAVAIMIWEAGDKLVPLLRSRRSAPTEVVQAPA